MQSRHQKKIITATAIVCTLATAVGFIYYKYCGSSPTPESPGKQNSKCYVLSKSLYESVKDWETELYNDTVVLVPPECNGIVNQLKAIEPNFEHKVIQFKSWEALWSTVRHMKKTELIISEQYLPHKPPDIERFVKMTIIL